MVASSGRSTLIAALCASAALAGCQKHASNSNPPHHALSTSTVRQESAPLSPHAEAGGIAWLADVDAAFAQARAQNKPVLLYWGAQWCVPCHELKAKLFTQRAFIEKTRRFVAVYLDGDDPGAQKWSEIFEVKGYPTLLILRPDRTELASFAGAGLDQYAAVLDRALGAAPAATDLMDALAAKPGVLSLEDCRLLAYSEYGSGGIEGYRSQDREALQRIAQRCPPGASVERTRLTAMSTLEPISREARAVLLQGRSPSARMQQALREVVRILEDAESLRATAGMPWLKELEGSGELFFDLLERCGVAKKAELYPRWLRSLDARADDPSLPSSDRLAAFLGKLKRVQGSGQQRPIAVPLATEARQRVAAALASTQSVDERSVVVDVAIKILWILGDEQRVREIYLAEIEAGTAPDPTHYMMQMATIEEGSGNLEALLRWLERGYRESKGPAMRFWRAVDYTHALIRHRPHDEAAVRKAAVMALGELEGPDRIYNKTREQLARLDRSLRQWNSSDQHAPTLAAIRNRMHGVCAQISAAEESAREACMGFLAEDNGPRVNRSARD